MRGRTPRAARVRQRRRELGMTQEHLAHSADCDVKTIRNAEAGRSLDVSTLQRIADALKIDLKEIVDGTPGPDSVRKQRNQSLDQWKNDWNGQAIDQLVELYHDDGILRFPSGVDFPGSGDFEGIDEICRHHSLLFEFCQLKLKQAGNLVIQPGVDAIFFRGEIAGQVISTGKTFRSEVLHEFRFRDEKVQEHLVLMDTASISVAMQGP